MDPSIRRALLDEAGRGRLALFIGADLPQPLTGLPSQSDLAAELAERYGVDVEATGLFAVAQRLGRHRRRDVLQFLMDRLLYTDVSPGWLDMTLVRWPASIWVTTRYDELLQKAFEEADRPVHVVVTDLDASLRRPERATLVKLYGDLRQPPTLTVSEDDLYDLASQKRGVLALVEQALSANTALFLGYDLDRPDFLSLWREVLRRLGAYAPLAYAVPARPMDAQARQIWRERQIEVLDVTVADAVRELATAMGQPVEPPRRRAATSPGPVAVSAQEPPVQRYRDFDLEIVSHGEEIHLRVLRSPEGEAETVVPLDDVPPRLDEVAQVTELGERLGRWLLAGGVGERWAAAVASAARAGEGVRLRLFLRDAIMAGLAWELARSDGEWVALRPHTPIVRYVSSPHGDVPWERERTLRVLLVVGPTEEIGLPLASGVERASVEAALEPMAAAGRIQVTAIDEPISATELLEVVRRVRPHVLHFAGHGVYDERTGRAGLLLVRKGAGGSLEAEVAYADALAMVLSGSPVRLAFFNACDSGSAAGGVAQAVVRAAVPMAVGMQATIPDAAAMSFSRMFYRALADGWTVEAAVVEGRRALALEAGITSPWWALPVLYVRTSDTRLLAER